MQGAAWGERVQRGAHRERSDGTEPNRRENNFVHEGPRKVLSGRSANAIVTTPGWVGEVASLQFEFGNVTLVDAS